MNIFVVGCGAMGSIYAALLATAGHKVSAVDTNVNHVNAINKRGLRVWGASGDRTEHINAYLQPPKEVADLVVLAVKASYVEQAAASISPLLGPETCVVTIQNGLGSSEIVARCVGPERLIIGVAQGFGASLPEPGCAHHNDMKAIRMGAYADLAAAQVARVVQIWVEAGFDVTPTADIAALQWEKLICNTAYSAPCAVTGLTVGEVLKHPQMGRISRAAAREAYEVAQALGITLGFDNPEQVVRDFAARMPNAKPSVLLDLEAGRTSEVNVINGAVVTQAQKIGMPAPINTALTVLVQLLETPNAV